MFKETREDIFALLDNMNINSDCVVVSQCNKNGIEKYDYREYVVTCIYSTKRGLSRSRNLALRHATADIVVIADDDVRYNDNYSDIIINAYIKHPSYDILTFKVKDNKKYFSNETRLNRLLIHKVASWEITMNLSSIKNISFNIIFGTGSSYFQCGEENIFLNDCIKNKKNIMFIPQKIACFPENSRPSTWFTGFDKKYMISQGAVYYELSRFLALPYILQFAIRKHSLYKKNINLFQAVYYMVFGILEYRKIKGNNGKNKYK
jgi:glycosyltransferase involved in cell wall biosynthesis